MDWLGQPTLGMYNWLWLLIVAMLATFAVALIILTVLKVRRLNREAEEGAHETIVLRVGKDSAEKMDAADTKDVESEQPEEEADESAEEDSVKDKQQPNKTQPAEKAADKKPAPAPEKKEQAKPSTKTYHISLRKSDGMWQVKAAGAEKAVKLFNTQAEAIEYCKPLAENQDANIMIHKKDGSFRKLTY